MPSRSLCALFFWVMLFAFAAPEAHAGDAPPGFVREAMSYGGLTREWLVHRPPRSGAPAPLILMLHGGGGPGAARVAKLADYARAADRDGIVLVLPEGVDGQWNDGRGVVFKSKERVNRVDDVGFIAALVKRFVESKEVDQAKVGVGGFSNGAMMTFRLLCQKPAIFTAAFAVIGSMPANLLGSCDQMSPISLLVLNGTDDPFIPYAGGPVRIFGKEYGEVLSTPKTVEFFRARNRCPKPPEIRQTPDRDRDGQSPRVETSLNCAGKTAVVLYSVTGGGHQIPGSASPDRPRLVGEKNRDLDAPALIWDFLRETLR